MPAALLSTPRAPAVLATQGEFSRRVNVPKPVAPAPSELAPGYALRDRADGLHLVRKRDGEDMGIMSSPALAARHSHALARMAAGVRPAQP